MAVWWVGVEAAGRGACGVGEAGTLEVEAQREGVSRAAAGDSVSFHAACILWVLDTCTD